MAAGDGFVTMTPTSITSAGAGSASINTNGGVDFTSCSVINFNGIFTSAYDHYRASIRVFGASDGTYQMRLRSGGTDNANSAYTRQRLEAYSGATYGGQRSALSTIWDAGPSWDADLTVNGSELYFWGPSRATSTAAMVNVSNSYDQGYIQSFSFTQTESLSFDGLSLIASANGTGTICFWGLEE